MPDDAFVPAVALSTAMNGKGILPREIRPIHDSFKVAGPAFTVDNPTRDNLHIHRAIYAAEPGEVVVVAARSKRAGFWGELMTRAALARRLGGLIIDGCVRDVEALTELGFPVFANGLDMQGTTKDGAIGGLQVPVSIGEVTIEPGDYVVGDADGIAVVPSAEVAETMAEARNAVERENEYVHRIEKGERLMDILELEEE